MGTSTTDFTTGKETSFAQKLADITTSSVIAVQGDQVSPTNSVTERSTMNYSPRFGAVQKTEFKMFEPNKPPQSLGRVVSAITVAQYAIARTTKITPIQPKGPKITSSQISPDSGGGGKGNPRGPVNGVWKD